MKLRVVWNFLKSKFLWKNIATAAILSLVALTITFYSLRYVTHHNEQVEVPNLIGLNEEEARVFLQQKGISLEVIDSVQVGNFTAGEVVEQNPEPHAFVKKGRRIYLTIKARTPRTVLIPEIQEVSLRQAKAVLESLGFVIADTIYVPSEFSGLVQQVQYKGSKIVNGERLPYGAKVVLFVGESSLESESTPLPSVITLSYNEALQVITAAGLTIGDIINDESIITDDDQQMSFVWKQKPDPHKMIPAGKRIDLWLTRNPDKLTQQIDEYVEEEQFF